MKREIDHIEFILDQYRAELGAQYVPYRNHVYRVYNLAVHLSQRPLTAGEHDSLAIAAAFHDLGIWTSGSLNYLEESVRLAAGFLRDFHLEDREEEIGAIIRYHHKLTAYRGAWCELVNLFRKADWIDVSWGLKAFGASRMFLVGLYGEFPGAGFHAWLARRMARHALRYPWKPLPMLKP